MYKRQCQYIADPEVGKIWEAEVAQDPVGIGAGIVDKIAEYFTTCLLYTSRCV